MTMKKQRSARYVAAEARPDGVVVHVLWKAIFDVIDDGPINGIWDAASIIDKLAVAGYAIVPREQNSAMIAAALGEP